MYRKGADYSFKEPKEPLSAPVLSPADTRSCIVIVVVVVVVVVILLLSRDLGSRQPLPYPLLFSPPRFFSNEFTRPSSFSRSFFPFLPKARATSASKHDDRPMMDRRIVDSPPPLSLVQEHSLNRVYRRRSSSSVIEHEIRRSIGRKLLSLKASLFLFFSWDGRRRWLPVHPIRGKITNGEPRGPPLSSILCPIYRNRASIPLLFLSSFFGRGLETLPPRGGSWIVGRSAGRLKGKRSNGIRGAVGSR